MVDFPQHDRPSGLSGARDSWDEGLAGELLGNDYFPEPSGDLTPPVATFMLLGTSQ